MDLRAGLSVPDPPRPNHGFVLTVPARPDAPDEDAARVAGPIAVLADGAGVPARYRAGCSHAVWWYSERLVDSLIGLLADPDLSMREALARAIAEVRRLHEGTCDLARGGPSATVVAVRAREGVLEHLVLCDSSLLLTCADGAVRRVTDTRVDDVARRERTPDAIEAGRNAPGGFWLARHEEEAAAEAILGRTALTDLAAVSLVSDGVTRAVDLLGLCGDEQLARRCRDPRTARELIAEIRRAEAERAAAGLPGPRKIHDDATIATLSLAPESW